MNTLEEREAARAAAKRHAYERIARRWTNQSKPHRVYGWEDIRTIFETELPEPPGPKSTAANYLGRIARPSRADCIYIAGLMDGDGHIGITHQLPRAYGVLASLTNEHYGVLDWAKGIWGGSIQPKSSAVCFEWVLRGRQAHQFLTQIIPYMVVRRRQAEIGCALAAHIRSFKGHRSKPLNDEVLGVREAYRLEILAERERLSKDAAERREARYGIRPRQR